MIENNKFVQKILKLIEYNLNMFFYMWKMYLGYLR
jgi:hypothetical protein